MKKREMEGVRDPSNCKASACEAPSGEAPRTLFAEGVLNPNNCRHGGNIYAASRRTGIPVERILDFSASINPLGVPKRAALAMKQQINLLPHYPEPYAETLTAAIAARLGVDPATIICGNGSTELIYLIPRVLKPAKVLLTAPTFSEYERACRTAGAAKLAAYELRRETSFDLDPDRFIDMMSKESCDIAFLCNPNNPTGRLLSGSDVLRIADAGRKLSCFLVVDEAFIDFCPAASVVEEVASNPWLIVLRSLTKFYALSGIRLGYGVFHPSVAEKMRVCKEPWTVNSLALAAGLASLEDVSYGKASLEAMEREKSFLEEALGKAGIEFVPSAANYYLLRIPGKPHAAAALEQKGILVRQCENFASLDPSYIRTAVRSRAENERLVKELAGLCGE